MGRFDASIAACRRARAWRRAAPNSITVWGSCCSTRSGSTKHWPRMNRLWPCDPTFPRPATTAAWPGCCKAISLAVGASTNGVGSCPAHRLLLPTRSPDGTEPLAPDATILLDAEQGLGDTIQFARYASLVKARVGRVILRCQTPLVSLLSSLAGVDQSHRAGRAASAISTLGFLCSACRSSLPLRSRQFHERCPTSRSTTALVRFWQSTHRALRRAAGRHPLARKPGLLEGSVSLDAPGLFRAAGQVARRSVDQPAKGAGSEQLTQRTATFPVLDLDLKPPELHGPFVDTAAILRCLDAVVTSDTSLAHLAGALGIETWLAVPHVPEWRWLLDREDTPWYPTLAARAAVAGRPVGWRLRADRGRVCEIGRLWHSEEISIIRKVRPSFPVVKAGDSSRADGQPIPNDATSCRPRCRFARSVSRTRPSRIRQTANSANCG